MLHKKVLDKIEFEITEIEKMLCSYDSVGIGINQHYYPLQILLIKEAQSFQRKV